MESTITRVQHDGERVRAIDVKRSGDESGTYSFQAEQFLSSMPLGELVEIMDRPRPRRS